MYVFETTIDGEEYFIVDTPGFEPDNKGEIFRQITEMLQKLQQNSIFGIWYLINNLNRQDGFDKEMVAWLLAFCGQSFCPNVTIVTTFWTGEGGMLRNQDVNLRQTLMFLAGSPSSPEYSLQDEVAQIVAISFKKVTELQQLVRNFMSFLLDINTIINYTAKRSQFVYETVKEKEDLIDPLIKRDLLEHAFDMKTRFIFASKASNVYNAVSSQYILPTLNMLPQLSRLDTDDELKSKLQELHRLRCRVRLETGALTKKMHEELKESLAEVTRDSARIFEDITSGNHEATEKNS
ncbi:hypothetical protein BDV06DRAFT_229237 [Aspergillus oleicola]